MPKVTPVVEPAAPRLIVAGALGVNARGPGPVKLNPGEVIVTTALLVPTNLYLAGCGAPEQVTFPPQPVSTPVWSMLITWPAQTPAPASTSVPKSRFWTKEIVRGL